MNCSCAQATFAALSLVNGPNRIRPCDALIGRNAAVKWDAGVVPVYLPGVEVDDTIPRCILVSWDLFGRTGNGIESTRPEL